MPPRLKSLLYDIRASKLSHALVALLTAVLATGIVVEVKPDHTVVIHGPTAVKVAVDGADPGSKPDETLTVPKAAVQQVESSDAGHHEDLRNEDPAGVTPSAVEQSQQLQDKLAAQDQLSIVAPDAAPSQAGCRSRFIPVNYSSRRGVAPHVIVLHLTVSPNVIGWSDVDGVTAFFARSATQASSNYVLDGEGHCNYIVREVDKAWAQAGFNPYAISIEVVNTGHEPVYIRAAGMKELARIVHDAAQRWHIPLQVGAVNNCVPTRYGIVTHQMLGLCGGGHVDITPYDDPDHKMIKAVIAAANAIGQPKPISDKTKTVCRKYAWFGVPGSKLAKSRSAAQRALHGQRRLYLLHWHIKCSVPGGVATRA